MRYNTIDEILRQQLLNPLQDVDGFRLYNTELQYALLSSIDKIFYSPGTPSTNSPWIPIDISSQGNVLVFSYYAIGNEWNGSSWVPKGDTLYGNSANAFAGFSNSLSSQGDVVAVGAIYDKNENGDTTGSVTIYKWDGTSWNLNDTIYGVAVNDQAGYSVSLSSQGDILLFSSIKTPNEQGEENGSTTVKQLM